MADNLNTIYLSPAGNGEIARSSSIGSYVVSDMSIVGTLDANIAQFVGAVQMDTTLAVTGATTQTGALGVTGKTTATGGLAVGAGLGTLSVVSTSLQSIAALTINDLESNQTTFACNWAAMGDIVLATPVASDLSNGLAYNAYVSAASTVALRFSNCSAVEAKPVAQNWRFTMLRFS